MTSERNNNIPQCLKDIAQWMTWELRDGQKIPNGKSNDPMTWHAFARVQNKEKIAYVFSDDCPFVGIDVDDCITEDGLTAFGLEVRDRFRGKAYGEISPSGTGIKLWVKATKPDWARCKNGNLEVYDTKRFFTVTGRVIEGLRDCDIDATQELDDLCRLYLRPATELPPKRTEKVITSQNISKRLAKYSEEFQPTNEGGRNDSAFQKAGHLRAFRDELDNPPSEEEIVYLMTVWNATNNPPLDHKELLKAIESSARNGTPRETKRPPEIRVYDDSGMDYEMLNKHDLDIEEELTDEEFCLDCVPASGLLRDIFGYYVDTCHQQSNIMGLAISLALCETLFGRRVRSHTDLRTNDYNMIIAPTSTGKEACEKVITKLLVQADATGSMLLPPDIQSGNGLMHAISHQPCGIWVCDEFGKMMQAFLDKRGNLHTKNIGNHLLKLYGKSDGIYGGAAHSDGVRNRVVQPHLVLLGLSTGSTFFSDLTEEQLSDGLIGRIAFFQVTDRPKPKEDVNIVDPSDSLIARIRNWIEYRPGTGNLTDLHPDPAVIRMTGEAKQRWTQHRMDIFERMNEQNESRAAVWARVAARSMKLALVHRCARLEGMATTTDFAQVQIEIEDIDWGIRLANWLARKCYSLVLQCVQIKSLAKAKAILLREVKPGERVSTQSLHRRYSMIESGTFAEAAADLGIDRIRIPSGRRGRPPEYYEWKQKEVAG